MKKTLLTLSVAALAFAFSTPIQAEEAKKGGFAQRDTDKSGDLSLEEFKAGKKDPEKAAKAFAKIDTDGDGKVTKEELKANKAKKKAEAPAADKAAE